MPLVDSPNHARSNLVSSTVNMSESCDTFLWYRRKAG
jgi:hypothetical protein